MLVASLMLAGLMLLRARLAMLQAAAFAAANPATGSPPTVAAQPDSTAAGLADLAVVRAEWLAYQKHLDAYLEAFNDLEEQVEHKRRRTTAAASRVAREEAPEEPEANSHAALVTRARSMG